ncbi:hypothetical protein [Leptobacterium sp. I13]|uniref:hypothetical protein n=1 Tax=Leptobacterium meishanense TaxID=3128904 RepID=UPI0030ED9623
MTKKVILFVLLFVLTYVSAQNTFPITGSVGIGTTTPELPLEVKGIDNWQLQLSNTSDDKKMFIGWYESRNAMEISTWKNGVWEDALLAIRPKNVQFDGNVGIGTATPDAKLTVKGHVTIGADGNYHLKTRHIDSKQTNSTEIDRLYLNYNTGHNVSVGWGSVYPASDLLVASRMGIGTGNPSYHLDIINQHEPTEAFLRLRVKDAPADYLSIVNPTVADGQFILLIEGHHESDNRSSIQIIGKTSEANDIGTNALVNFDARRPTGPIQTPPLFEWTSYTTKHMTMLANGNIGIGIVTPDTKLTVKGKIHTEEVKVDLAVPVPDYVFHEDYKLCSLEELQNYIKENKHLPNIPSAKDMETNGIELGAMNMKLLEKIEELTLYIMEQHEYQKILEKRLSMIEQNYKKK